MKSELIMTEERKTRSSVVRRTKRNGGWSHNKVLRQSVHELTTDFTDLRTENAVVRPSTLKRSKSFHYDKEDHVHIAANNSREILKQYVVNLADGDDLDDNGDELNYRYRKKFRKQLH